MTNDYLTIVRRLPRPTVRQTALFASYVADAHSWYKHLPVERTVPFHFFLNPHVGHYLARDAGGRATLLPIEDTAGHIHYTAQKTTDYLRRFGFWDYDADYGTSLLYPVGDHVADTRSRGPRIVNDEGKWIPVPIDVLESGRAEVNAFVHRHASLSIWERWLRGHPRRDGLPTGFPKVEDHLRMLAANGQSALIPLPSAVQKRVDGQDVPSFLLWRRENLFEELLDLVPGSERAREELFPALLEHLESKQTLAELESAFRCASFSDAESAKLAGQFHDLLFPERLRQLRELRMALNRVVEFIYGGTE